jgi:hypothetical protein
MNLHRFLNKSFGQVTCLLLFWVLSFCAVSATKVYKVVNPDGSISYSDQAQNNAEELSIEPVPTIPAYRSPLLPNTQNEESQSLAIYTRLSIDEPRPNAAFNSGNGDVSIRVSTDPNLKASHFFEFYLDGELVGQQESASLLLNNVDRGSHTISVVITNGSGNEFIKTTNNFTIHRPSIQRAR